MNKIISLIFIIVSVNLVTAQTNIKNTVTKKMNFLQKKLEGFEYENPSKVYKIELNDRSDLKIYSTRDSFDGKFSLKLNYSLDSDSLWGSKVLIYKDFNESVDIKGFLKGSIMVKGDGSLNVLTIQFIDKDGEIYSYEATGVLENNGWHEVVFSRMELILDSDSPVYDSKLGSAIKGIKIVISNPFSDSGSGTIYLDDIKLFYSMNQFVNRAKKKATSKEPSERIFKNSYLDMEYRNINRYRSPGTAHYAKEFVKGDLMWMYFYLNTDYRFNNFLVTGLIGFSGRDFSLANEKWGKYDLFGQDLKLIIDATEFLKIVNNVEIGMITPSFNNYTFYNSGNYRFEGINLNGKLFSNMGYDKTGYNLFLVKGWNDTYTIGFKHWYNLFDININLYGVLARDNALVRKNDYSFQSKTVMEDDVIALQLVRGINLTSAGGFMVVWANYGHHFYKRTGKVYIDDGNGNLSVVSNEYQLLGDEVDFGNVTFQKDSEGNPIYEDLGETKKYENNLYNLRLRFKDIPFKSMEENFEFNYIEPYYKPKYSKREVIISEKSLKFGILYDLNKWSSFGNWKFGITTKFGESTLPKTDYYYFSNLRQFDWSIGKYIGLIGLSFVQSHMWRQTSSSRDERLNSYWLYNNIIISMKFTQSTIANIVLRDVKRKLYETGKTDVFYYGTQYKFNFKIYFTDEALLQIDYVKTNPPDGGEVFLNTWELDNLIKVLLHVDFKF